MTKVKGSKDGKIITASFDGSAKQYFPALNNTKALVLLSIKGNEFCAGNYLGAIIQRAIATHAFTTFLIADEIFWHNLKQNDFTPNQEPTLRQTAIELGAEYFERNLPYFLEPLAIDIVNFNETHKNKNSFEKIKILNQLAIKSSNFEVLNWQGWVNDEEYQAIKKTITELYDSVDSLKQSIEHTAKNYMNRRKNNSLEEFDLQKSKGYLIEECPAIIWLGAQRNYNFIVYPGEIVEALETSKDFFIVDKSSSPSHPCCFQVEKPQKLLNWLVVNFKRRHAENSPSILAHDSKTSSLISEITKGITLAIFALPYDESTKINLLAKFSTEYLKRLESKKIEPNDVIDDILKNNPVEESIKKVNQEITSN